MSERIIVIDVDRTPEDEYRGAAMWAHESAAARDGTQQTLADLDDGALYHTYGGDPLVISKAEIVKATAKQYKVRYLGYTYTIPRAPADAGETVEHGHFHQFAFGRSLRPRLEAQLAAQAEAAARCIRKMEEKFLALWGAAR